MLTETFYGLTKYYKNGKMKGCGISKGFAVVVKLTHLSKSLHTIYKIYINSLQVKAKFTFKEKVK